MAAVTGLVLGLSGCSSAPTKASDEAATPAPSRIPSPTPSTSPSPRPTPTPTPTRQAQPRETTSTAVPGQLKGLVRIVATIGSDGQGETSTGMVLTPDGTVVTNNHAVAGAGAVQATVWSSGRVFKAQVEATDPAHDVALLRLINASGLATVTPADRNPVVGDPVTVVGDAHGLQTSFTASTGRVLSLNRTLVTASRGVTGAERLNGLVLFSCDVVSGESGGPTYDDRGRVVAMTTATVPGGTGTDGVGIPVRTLLGVVRMLRAQGAS